MRFAVFLGCALVLASAVFAADIQRRPGGPTCFDSDGGFFPDIPGTCSDSYGSYDDTCYAYGVGEYRCDTYIDRCVAATVYCPAGCENGACLSVPGGSRNILSLEGTATDTASPPNPLTDGDIRVRVYDSESGENLVYNERFFDAIKSDGSFSILVGGTLNSLFLKVNTEYWLALYIDDGTHGEQQVGTRTRFMSAAGPGVEDYIEGPLTIGGDLFVSRYINGLPVGESIPAFYNDGTNEVLQRNIRLMRGRACTPTNLATTTVTLFPPMKITQYQVFITPDSANARGYPAYATSLLLDRFTLSRTGSTSACNTNQCCYNYLVVGSEVAQPTCDDTADGGQVWNLAGITYGYRQDGSYYEYRDSCLSNTRLNENYCDTTNPAIPVPKAAQHDCGSGSCCLGGACTEMACP